jgi:NAD(P)-dependent dehydrogenase (short-subunit alcohol dehydrogenase family)
LNGLVNNAGAAFATKALSPDGYERTIAINHIAVAALTEGLLDLLRKGADEFATPSRVVNMTALIESRGNPITDWSYPGKYSQMHAYADAKLLALMYTYAEARRHQGDGLTFNAVSPGTVNSGFGGKAGGTFKIIQALMKPFVGPPEKGSRGCVRLLADPDLATATGGYYSSAKLKKSSKKSRDHDAQDRVYELAPSPTRKDQTYGRFPCTHRGHSPHPIHRRRRCRPLTSLLHRRARRRGNYGR